MVGLVPAPGFPVNLPHIFIAYTFQHNTTLTYAHPRRLLNLTDTHHSATWLAEVVQKLKMGHNSASIRCIADPNA